MDLKDILNKTKKKVDKASYEIKRPSVADDDRPYQIKSAFDYCVNAVDEFEHKPNLDNEQVKLETKLGQSEDTLNINPTQTLHDDTYDTEKDDKALAEREQCVSNALAEPLAEREQCVSNVLAKREQSVSNALAKALAEPLAEREQCVSNALARQQKKYDNEIIETLVGHERILLNFLFQKCKLIGSLETSPITTDELKNTLKIGAEHLRNLIYRLSSKGIIEVSKVKNGKAGWRKFKFSQDTFQYLSLGQSVSNALAEREQSVSNALAKALAEPLATSSSSSSNNIYIKTTTTSEEEEKEDVDPEWYNIDFSEINFIGFTQTHVLQIAKQEWITPQQLQDSIDAFAFDLRRNNKAQSIRGDLLNFFVGIVRRGRVYNFPSNYKSPIEESHRIHKAQLDHAKLEQEKLEQEIFELEFYQWETLLTEDDKKQMMAPGVKYAADSKLALTALKNYFRDNVYVKKPLKPKKTELH